jgi:membrane protease YdiL (CAAX protease family)
MRFFHDRARKPPKRFDLLLTVLGMLGIVLFVSLYDRAFPPAALELKLSRKQIADRATAYMRDLGYDLAGYEFALTFDEAWMSSVYLQQTLGIPRTNALTREKELPLWTWQARWFKPLQKEEFYLSLMPDGTVVALTHSVLEDSPGADIAQQAARTLAEAYLVGDRGWALDGWEIVSSSTVAHPGGRSDHHFEWKRLDWDVGQSELRLAVDIQGDTIGGYGYWIKVPETFIRHFSEQRNRAGFISTLSFYLGAGGCGVVAFGYYFVGHRRGIFTWREGVAAGVVVAVVATLAALNNLSLKKAWYGTTQDYALFWIERLIGVSISALSVAGVVTVLWAGGRYLARKTWPRRDVVLARADDRWIALSRSTWRGLMLGGLDAGYVVLFYLVATQILGGWTPMDVPPVDLYATPLPFVEALASGIIPAITEEFTFRLIGIGIVLAIVKKRWLAVLVPGVLWAFAHLGYVRDPILFRGIELTIPALIYGTMFLRFDLTTTIVAHLAYNATLTAIPLLRSGQPYFVANGTLVIVGLVVPLLPGAVRWLRRRFQGEPAMPTPTIRQATASDIAGLVALNVEGTDWARWMKERSTTVLCLYVKDRVIGGAAGKVNAGNVGWVYTVFVAPEWRRRYWASRLVEALGDRLRERGAQSLQTKVSYTAWRQARFWDAQDWSPWATVYGRSFKPSQHRRVPAVLARFRGWVKSRGEIRKHRAADPLWRERS